MDISHNRLDDKIFMDGRYSNLNNLTEFYMSNNRFLSLPIKQLSTQDKLKVLDVRFNQISEYYPEFSSMIKEQGLDIYYEGE